jgi:hypothetical protein
VLLAVTLPLGSRSAAVRRSKPTRFSSANDDEHGGLQARIRARVFAPPICRRSRRNESRTELILRHRDFVGSDEDGGYPRTSQRAV